MQYMYIYMGMESTCAIIVAHTHANVMCVELDHSHFLHARIWCVNKADFALNCYSLKLTIFAI